MQTLNGYSEEQVAHCFSSRRLELILLPTEKCNFRCTYCYETFELGKMPRHIVDGVKNLVCRRASELDHLSLSWFGGEPLLQKDICMEIAEHCMQLSRTHGFDFGGGFTTNAYLLTLEDVRRFSEVNHREYQITLDGDGEIHDSTRVLANGRGTFARIWSNLLQLHESNLEFSVTLRLHLSPKSYDSMLVLTRKIQDLFGVDHRFRIHFHRITDLGGPNSGEFPTYTYSEYAEALQTIRESSTLTVPSNSEIEIAANKGICYAAKPNSLLVRSNGRLGKCTVAFEDPRNNIGHINPDGTIEVDHAKWRLWFKGFEHMDDKLLGCPYSALPNSLTSESSSELQINVIN